MTFVKAVNMAEGATLNVVDTLATFYTVPTGYQAQLVSIVVINSRNAIATWAITVNVDGTDYPVAEGYQVAAGQISPFSPGITVPAGTILKSGCDLRGGSYTPIITGLGVTFVMTIQETKV